MSNKTKTTATKEGGKPALVPKRRFPEFQNDEDWKNKPLSDCLAYQQPTPYLVSDTNYSPAFKTPVLTAGKTFILGYTDEQHGIFSEGLPVIIFDDFTTATQFVNFPFKAKSSAMKILEAKNGADIKFMYETLQNLSYEVGAHERHWISNFAAMLVPVPKPTEQQKIADCLSSVDELIAAQSRKLTALKTHKKGLMQQLFPREGETQPRLRFPEFENAGEWVVEPLEQLANYENGKAYEKDITEEGKYVVVNSRFISTDGAIRKYTNAEYLVAKAGEVLMVLSDLPKGRALAKCYFVEADHRYAVNQRVCRLKPRQIDGKFLYYALNRHPRLLAFDDGLNQTHLSKGGVTECPLCVPPQVPEQQRIADCLTSLDDLIAAQTQKLAAIKTHKRGLMQQLFPAQAEEETQGLVESTLRSVTEDKPPTNRPKNSGAPSNIIEFSRDYSRTVLAAEIIDRIGTHATFGHVKLQKILFLAEHTGQLDEIESHCVRAAAGPYDREMLNEIDAKLRECEWFSNTTGAKGRRTYHRLPRAGEHRESFERLWPEKTAPLRALIDSLKEWSTEQCECIATVYGAWNDLLRAGKPVNKEAIFSEIFTRWHPDKTKIPESKWREAHTYLRKNGLVPTGYGKPTRTESDDQPELSI